MNRQTLVVALAAAFSLGSAQAVTFNGATGAANVTSYSSGSSLSFDLDFSTLGMTTLNFTVEAADAGGSASFNSLVRNLSGLGFSGVSFAISGATFSAPGTITTDGFQAVAASGSTSTGGWAMFTPALTTDFYLGAPLGAGTDWTINLAGAQVGDTFSIAVSVPEPESYALMLAGLCGVLAMARRRRV